MNNGNFWSVFFKLASAFNVVAALAIFFTPDIFFGLLSMSTSITAEATPWTHQFAAVVFVFGIFYWVLSNDPEGRRDIILIGGIGKTAVFSMAWIDVVFYGAPLGFALLVVADLIFAIFFAVAYKSLARN